MFGKNLVAASLLAWLALWVAGSALAQVRVETRVEVPDRRPDTSINVDLGDLVGGLFALRDGYERGVPGLLCVLAYEDRNGNGRRERGEGPLPGWTYTVEDGMGATVAQGQSNKDGRFCASRPLPPGPYAVRQSPGAGWSNTEPGAPMANFKPVTLPPDKGLVVLIGNCRGEGCARGGRDEDDGPFDPSPQGTGKVCIEKYNDLNHNGVRDAGEPPLPGWHFALWHYTTLVFDQGTTDADGRWCSLHDLAPLTYKAIETSQPNWHNSEPLGPPMAWVPVWPNQTTTIQFGNYYVEPPPPPPPPLPVNICIKKFNDLNGDGVQQPNEPPVPGVDFAIFTPSYWWGPGIAPGGDPTNNEGISCSSTYGHLDGTWSVTEGFWNYFHPGWTATTPGGETQQVQASQGNTYNLVFGNRQTTPQKGRLCVAKYEDLDGDGVRDPGEPPLPAWTFTLTTGQTGATDANGSICWHLPIGGYTITETMQPGWTSTDPGGLSPAKSASVTEGALVQVDFGNRRLPPPLPGRVCIIKYNDLQGDGIQGMGDPPLVGWTFNLKTLAGATAGQIVTVANPAANCRDLPPGQYVAQEVTQAGWINTDPPGASPQKPFTVTSGMTMILGFGNRQPPLPGEICVEKYEDLDGDAQRDTGEGPLPGWAFVLRNAQGVVIAQGSTGANGRWCANALLPPGTYTVTETLTGNWTSTDPGGSSPVKTVVVGPNATVTVLFGNRSTAPSAANLTIVKTKLTAGICHGSAAGANNCTFRFTITNTGGTAYTGPLSINDTVTMGGPLPVSVVTPPPGWTCSTGVVTPVVCSLGNVTIAAGATVTYDITLFLNAAAPSQNNCAVLTWGGGQQTQPACAQIFP